MAKLSIELEFSKLFTKEVIEKVHAENQSKLPAGLVKFCEDLKKVIESGRISELQNLHKNVDGLSFSAEDMIRQRQMFNNLRSLM